MIDLYIFSLCYAHLFIHFGREEVNRRF